MRKRIFYKNLNLIPIFFLGALSFFIGLVHFHARFWLTGWDNLHPEFSFWLNISRSLFSVWQEYQGLGLLAGMGHASDFPRQIFLWIVSFVLPGYFLRFFWHFLMLFIGPIGVYFLTNKLIFNKRRLWAAFLAGLFYLLNLATVQTFYLPFETFTAFYGFLPWFLYLVVCYLTNSSRRILFWYFLLSLVSTTSWYVPSLFVVYILALLAIFGGIFIRERKFEILKQASLIFLITFVANAFWLLPYIYFTFDSSYLVGQAYQNFISTEDVFLRNKEFGDLANVALLRSFWFKFVDWDANRVFHFMTAPWREYLANLPVLVAGYGLFAVVVLGLVYQIVRRNRFSWAFVLLFLVPFVMLANDIPPFSFIIAFLQNFIPLFRQVFRVPFTKFGILAALSYSLLFASGGLWLMETGERFFRKSFYGVFVILTGMIICFTYPVFRGDLVYKDVFLKIPQEYFELMSFFEDQDPSARIANFPQQSFWGWNHFRWNYRGSGFLWYGIEQPILDRAFDGFSEFNENYYWQISQAIYSQNLPLLESILEKYQINWLVLDKNVLSSSYYQGLNLEELEEMFAKSERAQLAKDLETIKIYRVDLQTPVKDFVFLEQNLPSVGPLYKWNDEDVGFVENGHYISNSDQQPGVYYPFRSLFTGRGQDGLEFVVEDTGDNFVFSNELPQRLVGLPLSIPELSEPENVSFTEELNQLAVEKPEVILKKDKIEVKIDKQKGYFSYDSSRDENFFGASPENCDAFNTGMMERDVFEKDEEKVLRFSSVGSSNCASIDLPNFSQKIGYLVRVDSRYFQGKSIYFYIINKTSQKSISDVYLPKSEGWETSYFIIPPMEEYGLGYSLHFDNISIGREKTVNDLGRVGVYPIPYRFLKEIKLAPGDGQQVASKAVEDFEVKKRANWWYEVELPQATSDKAQVTLVLSQAYHSGWMAYQITNDKLQMTNLNLPFWRIKPLEHVLVNNWENGFTISNLKSQISKPKLKTQSEQAQNQDFPATIYIVFWPQGLEFIGFGLLLGFIIWSLKRR